MDKLKTPENKSHFSTFHAHILVISMRFNLNRRWFSKEDAIDHLNGKSK